jgi:hypothetical protein
LVDGSHIVGLAAAITRRKRDPCELGEDPYIESINKTKQ